MVVYHPVSRFPVSHRYEQFPGSGHRRIEHAPGEEPRRSLRQRKHYGPVLAALGLVDGLGVDESTKEGKIIKAMSALLGEMAEVIESVDEDLSRAYDQINDLSEELEDLEADLYEDDEDDEEPEEEEEDTEEDDNDDDIASEPFYEVACPNCGETVYVSEDDLDAGEANCAHCGVTFEVALEDEDEEQEEGPVQYEVTCPDCGTTAVFEEEELLEGEPKCPNCGKPLDFEVTEE